jgi:hypothetical protein
VTPSVATAFATAPGLRRRTPAPNTATIAHLIARSTARAAVVHVAVMSRPTQTGAGPK